MKAPKPTQSLVGQTCPACHTGKFALVQIDHVETLGDENEITFRGLWVDKCEHCGEIVFPGDTTHFIETEVAEHTEQLTPRELEHIREDLGVPTQDEMSEILGLGSKTYHKWESGKQLPNRSMCYYIRLLAEFPAALEWLRSRNWRKNNRVARLADIPDLALAFPDLATTAIIQEEIAVTRALNRFSPNRNPARGLLRVDFNQK